MRMNVRLAELFGAMMGDGCLSLINNKSENRKRKIALLTGHLKHDYNYYTRVIQPIVKENFKINGYIKKREKRNCIYYEIGGVVFDFLNNEGFPIGLKTKLFIPQKILRKRQLARACVRGIFNTAGTIYRRYRKKYNKHPKIYNYQVIQFKLNSKRTIKQIKGVLDRININSNRIIRDKKSYVLRITDQTGIKKFMEKIRPSNNYHVERYINHISDISDKGLVAQPGQST